MPNAVERREILAQSEDGEELIPISCKAMAPFAAQVFKTTVDPFVGKLNIMKVFRGILKAGSTVYNANTGKTERISQIYLLKGKKQEPTAELGAGDIGAVSKLANTNTGDTLCDDEREGEVRPHPFPPPRPLHGDLRRKEGRGG